MKNFTLVRKINLIAFLICCFLLSTAGYIQLSLGEEPCPLCIIQRVIVFILTLFFLAGALHTPKKLWLKITGFLTFIIAGFGALVAGKQIWLQHLPPDQVPPCGPDLSTLLHNLPFTQVAHILFQGTADCAKVTWRFLNLSIPEWTIIFFILFALIGLWQLFSNSR